MPGAGVLYIAYNQVYLREAINSAESVKRHCPDIRIALFSNSDPNAGCFDDFREIPVSHVNHKIDVIDQSPYERTIYLDSDTKIVFPIYGMLDLMERFDLAACHDFARKRKSFKSNNAIEDYEKIPYEFPEYNGGVMVFRKNEKVLNFFENWRSLFYRHRDTTGNKDQPSLRIALWNSNLKIHTMPPEFNIRSLEHQRKAHKMSGELETFEIMRPRILHWRGVNLNKAFSLTSRLKGKYRKSKY